MISDVTPLTQIDAVQRIVEKRAAVIDDKIERLRFVRQSIAAHEAAAQRSLTGHQASRRRFYLALRIVSMAVLLAVGLVPQASRGVSRRPMASAAAPARPVAAEAPAPKVWLVERQASVEIYSNGLRVDNEFLTSTRTRAYRAYDLHD